MSDNSSVYIIAVVLLIVNIVTPIFAYALTDLTIDQDFTGDIPFLDNDDLVASGIYLAYAERQALTYEGAPDYVTFTDNVTAPFRVRWFDNRIPLGEAGDFEFYAKKWGVLFGIWLQKNFYDVLVDGVRYPPDQPINNMTLITGFDQLYNWTRVTVPTPGYEFFITADKYDHNMSLAVENGEINVTLGVPVSFQNYDPTNFIAWYWGLMSGTESWGIPPYIAWVFRLQALLLVFSGTIIARDLIGFT